MGQRDEIHETRQGGAKFEVTKVAEFPDTPVFNGSVADLSSMAVLGQLVTPSEQGLQVVYVVEDEDRTQYLIDTNSTQFKRRAASRFTTSVQDYVKWHEAEFGMSCRDKLNEIRESLVFFDINSQPRAVDACARSPAPHTVRGSPNRYMEASSSASPSVRGIGCRIGVHTFSSVKRPFPKACLY